MSIIGGVGKSGDENVSGGYGVGAGGDIIISANHVTITGGAARGRQAFGGIAITANDGDVIISGSNVEIVSGDAQSDSHASGYTGIRASGGKVAVSGSKVSMSAGHATGSGKTDNEPAILCDVATISGSDMYAVSYNEEVPAIQTNSSSLILQVPAQESADGKTWTDLDMNDPNHTLPYFRTTPVAAGGGQSSVPRTGDSANVALWMAMLAGSAAAMCAIAGKRCKA